MSAWSRKGTRMHLQTVIRKSRALAFFALALAASLNLNAQSTFGSIRGTAVDQSGAAIAGVVISLHSVDENTTAETICDDNGNFVFENLKPGHYSITAHKGWFRASGCQPSGNWWPARTSGWM